MKKITILVSLVALFSIASVSVQAQVTATATAAGTIVAPIAIAKNIDMNFGNVAVNAVAGTVVLATDDSRSKTGGVTLPAVAGTVTAAQFTVTGTAGYAYTFTVPTVATTVSNGTDNMTITNFTSNSLGLLTGGTEVVKVGATLNVGASISAGLYTSAAPFTVTVNYN